MELSVLCENVAVVFSVAPVAVLFVAAAVFFADVAASAAVALAVDLYAAVDVLFSVVAAPASVALVLTLSGALFAVPVVVWLFLNAVCCGVLGCCYCCYWD